MIKVLEHGVRKVTCSDCKAKLQYEQEDVQQEIVEEFLGENKIREYIICPDCKNKIILTPTKR